MKTPHLMAVPLQAHAELLLGAVESANPQQCNAGAGLAAAPEFTKAGVAVDLGQG